jgi:hypothetical protein
MKRLFVWLASVSICAAQAVSIGPFATEDWVEDKIKEAESVTNGLASVSYVDDVADEIRADFPDVSGFATKAYVDAVSNAIPDSSTFATVEYVNTTSNNLALLMDDLVSEEKLGSSVSNIVPAWALVPIPPATAEVDPVFTNWLATTNVVIDDNVGTFVSNMVPSWALVPIPPVTVEVDPAFTNWLATTNAATVQYVDSRQWDWDTQVTNAPDFATYVEVTNIVDAAVSNRLNSSTMAEVYDPAKTYFAGDYATYNGNLYKCLAENTGTFDTSKWQVVQLYKNKLYDAEVEWIALGGSVYIDTGITNAPIGFKTTMKATSNLNNGFGEKYFSGAESSAYFSCPYGSGSWASISRGGPSSSGHAVACVSKESAMADFHEYELTSAGIVYCDGEQKGDLSSKTQSSGTVFYVGAVSKSGGLYSGQNAQYKETVIYINGVAVRDFIPVRKGQVGYYYDKVEGELYSPVSGVLSFGPDKAPKLPSMDGVASAGTDEEYSRFDHVHPSDTSKADKSYVDSRQWDWYTQVTNAPSFVEYEVDPAFTNWLATTNFVYSNADGKWTAFGDYEIDPFFILKYESEGSGNVETVGGDSLFNPTKVALFVNEDDDGYLLHNIGRDITIDLRPASVLTLANYTEDADLSIGKRNLCTELGGSFIASSNANTTSYGVGKVTGNNLYEYLWPAKSGTIAIVEDLARLASYQDVTNTVKAITNLADRIISGSNEAYVDSSGVYYKHPDSYGLPATLSFNAADDVHVGVETFPSNYTVVINLPEVTASKAPPIPIYGISADGKWELETMAGDNTTGWINYIDGGSAAPVFRITGFTGNNFSIVLDMSIPVVPDPNATLTRSTVFAYDKLTTESFVYDVDKYNAKPDIDYENSILELTWGSGAIQKAYLPYYNDPSQFPQASQGAITTNGNGSVNVARVSSNSVSGNDNFVFGNSNSVFGDNVTVFGNGNLVTNSNGAAVLGYASHTVKNSGSSLVSGNGSNDLEDSPYSIITGVGGTRVINSPSSIVLSGGGGSVVNSASSVFLAPSGTSVYDSSHVLIAGNHHNTVSNAAFSVVLGSSAVVTNNLVFIWNGEYSPYSDHGAGTFNVSPAGGTDGFYVGENSLTSLLALDAIAPSFLPENVYTNGDYVIYDRHLYECTNYTGTAGWRAGDWQQTTVTEILGNLRRILDAINGEAL